MTNLYCQTVVVIILVMSFNLITLVDGEGSNRKGDKEVPSIPSKVAKKVPSIPSERFNTEVFASSWSQFPLVVQGALPTGQLFRAAPWIVGPMYRDPRNLSQTWTSICTPAEMACQGRPREETCADDVFGGLKRPAEKKPTKCLPVDEVENGVGAFLTRQSEGFTSTPLWVLWSTQHQSCVALMKITYDVGKELVLPPWLKDFDLTELDTNSTVVAYLSWVADAPGMVGFEPEGTAARLLCALDGQTDVTLTPQQSEFGNIGFTKRLEASDCLYIPHTWSVKMTTLTSSSLLMMTWKDELVLSETFFNSLMEEEASEMEQESSMIKEKQTLSSAMNLQNRVKKVSWLAEPLLPYLIRRYFFSITNYDIKTFTAEVLCDKKVMKDLVDCPGSSYCAQLVKNLFTVLDVDADGVLTAIDDVSHLTPSFLEHMEDTVDDIVQELNDLGEEQWAEGMQDKKRMSQLTGHMERLKRQSVHELVQRMDAGDMDPQEMEQLKLAMPDMYNRLKNSGKLEKRIK